MIKMNDCYYNRILEDDLIFKPKTRKKVKLLLGPRQSGKSTLLKHYIKPDKTSFTINLQDSRIRRQYETEDGLLIKEIEANIDIKTIFIDEIQKVPKLLDDIQYLYDKDPNRYSVYITGSSSRQLKYKSANLLPGRVHNLYLAPVLLAEQRECILLPFKKCTDPFPLRSLKEYLIYGNLPGLYHEDKDSWAETLTSYAELYIENEIRKENIVNDMGAFQRFIKLAALESGQFVNHTKLAHIVGVAPNTLRNFFQVLIDTYTGIFIMPFTRSRKRITSAPRFLIFDIGLRHVLAGLPLNNSLLKIDAGHIFEQFILLELYHRCKYRRKTYQISTWRTSTGAEVDAIIETPDEIIPVEIKWTENPKIQDIRHLETFINLHKNSKKGYIICRCKNKLKLSDRIYALSWDQF